MRNDLSRFHLISSETAELNRSLTTECAHEGKTMYAHVAERVCRPGMPFKQMDPLVSRALGNFPLWRVRAMRLGDAGCFSAAALRGAQKAYVDFMARHTARAAAADAVERARQVAADRFAIKRYLAQHRAEVAKLEARLANLGEADPA